MSAPCLFTPFKLRELTLKNRVVISPMCQHAAVDGVAQPWHLVHLGKFALGGASLILTESTAVSADGRIGIKDLGIWRDDHIAPLKQVVDFVHDNGAAMGVQLAHAGRKAGSQALWEGGAALTESALRAVDPKWQRLAPSALPAGPAWSTPKAMTPSEIDRVVNDFVAATHRAETAGFDVVELHFGHGYLVAAFLSPNANHRDDAYGGDRDRRMALALRIAREVRAAWPAHKPLFCRISAVDGSIDGWNLEDSIHLVRTLKECGVDLVDCSSGGLTEETRALPVPRGLGFQVPFAETLRREGGLPTQAVGMIVLPEQAETILQNGQADLIAIGRAALHDPYWAHHARESFNIDPHYHDWPIRHGIWLAKRAPTLQRALAELDAGPASPPESLPT